MAERSAPTHPDGNREFELVLGNKQLFSLLFIMFVLLGVFFAMGYTLGRTSAPPETATASPGGSQTPAASRPSARPSVTGGGVPAPQSDAPAERQSERVSEQATAPARSATEEPTTASMIDPKPGQIFCQVTAVARPEAELLVEVLAKKGFQAAMAPGPDKFVRVLVGPAASDADLVKLKTDLEQAGFKPFVRRY